MHRAGAQPSPSLRRTIEKSPRVPSQGGFLWAVRNQRAVEAAPDCTPEGCGQGDGFVDFPQHFELGQFGIELLVHLALFLFLAGDEALQLGNAVFVLTDLATQGMGALLGSFCRTPSPRPASCAAPAAQQCVSRQWRSLVHDQQGGIALNVVGGLVGIACHQRALAALFFDGPHALFSLFALLGFQGRTPVSDSEGPIWRRVIPEGLNSAARGRDIPGWAVRRDAAPMLVNAGVDTLPCGRRLCKGKRSEAPPTALRPCTCSPLFQVPYPSVTPYFGDMQRPARDGRASPPPILRDKAINLPAWQWHTPACPAGCARTARAVLHVHPILGGFLLAVQRNGHGVRWAPAALIRRWTPARQCLPTSHRPRSTPGP